MPGTAHRSSMITQAGGSGHLLGGNSLGSRGGRAFLEAVGAAEFLAKPLHAAGGVDKLLLACKKRMASAANIHRNAGQSAARGKRISASAMHIADLIFRVGFLFHDN